MRSDEGVESAMDEDSEGDEAVAEGAEDSGDARDTRAAPSCRGSDSADEDDDDTDVENADPCLEDGARAFTVAQVSPTRSVDSTRCADPGFTPDATTGCTNDT